MVFLPHHKHTPLDELKNGNSLPIARLASDIRTVVLANALFQVLKLKSSYQNGFNRLSSVDYPLQPTTNGH